MRFNRHSPYLPLAAALLLGACAGKTPSGPPPPEPSAAVRSDEATELATRATIVNVEPRPVGADETVCRKEAVLGSHRPRTVCRTRSQRDATRAAAQDWYRSGGRNGEISQVPTVQ
jgi:hypothetical protein